MSQMKLIMAFACALAAISVRGFTTALALEIAPETTPIINSFTEESNITEGSTTTEQATILSFETNVSLTTSNISAAINTEQVRTTIKYLTPNASLITNVPFSTSSTTSIQVPATNSSPINTGPALPSAPTSIHSTTTEHIFTAPSLVINNLTSSAPNSGAPSTETGSLLPSGYISNAPASTSTTTSVPSTNGHLSVPSSQATITSHIRVSTPAVTLTTLTPQLCNCGSGAICQLTSSISAICICQSGYNLNSSGTCVDIDECALGTNNCSSNSNCTNTLGSFSCTCKSGFTGNGYTCTALDYCATESYFLCGNSSTCVSLNGGYVCGCQKGYSKVSISSGRYNCLDINECATNNGKGPCLGNSSVCVNTPGSYICTCPSPYVGDGYNYCFENVTFNLNLYGRNYLYFSYYYYWYYWGLQEIWLDCYYLPINNWGYRYLFVSPFGYVSFGYSFWYYTPMLSWVWWPTIAPYWSTWQYCSVSYSILTTDNYGGTAVWTRIANYAGTSASSLQLAVIIEWRDCMPCALLIS